jgi:hypothetical protein
VRRDVAAGDIASAPIGVFCARRFDYCQASKRPTSASARQTIANFQFSRLVEGASA